MYGLVVVVGGFTVVDVSVVGVCADANLPGPGVAEPSLRPDTTTTMPATAATPTTITAATRVVRRPRPRRARQRAAREAASVAAGGSGTMRMLLDYIRESGRIRICCER